MTVIEPSGGQAWPRRRPASIRDVARLAGVSHQTVSRVLNGNPSIRDGTKSRVLAAMDELQFRPSRAARMLSRQRSQTIGILAAAVGGHYGPASSVSAVEDAARERGYYATVAHLASVAPNAISAAITDLLSQDVEGIVIVAPRITVLSLLAALPMTVPIVAAQGEPHNASGIPVASVNQEAGARMVLEHLVERGHRRILHVAGPPDWNDAQLRLRAYRTTMQEAGLPSSPPLFGDWTSDSGFEIGRALTKDGADSPRAELPFTAVFSSNDQMALGLIHAFRAAGLDVPRDVSIVGFDDIPESAHFWPPLTTVRQDFRNLGVRCVSMLLDAIHRAEDPAAAPDTSISPVVEPQLVIRDSVAWVLAWLPQCESLTEAPEHAIIVPRCYRSHSQRGPVRGERYLTGVDSAPCRAATRSSPVPETSMYNPSEGVRAHARTDRADRPRGLVPHRKPAPLRGGDAPPGSRAVAGHRRRAGREP